MGTTLTPSKKWIKTVGISLAILLGLDLSKNLLIQTVIGTTLSNTAHVPVSIGSTDLNLFKGSVRIKNLRLSNPKGYSEKWMAEVPEIFVDLDPTVLAKGQIHAQEIRVFVSSFSVIKNKEGKLNIQALKSEVSGGDKEGKAKHPVRSAQSPGLKIDKLYLTLGKVFYRDYSHQGPTPEVQEFDLGIQNRLYKNIDNPSAVVSLIVLEAVTRTAISRLANLDLSFFKEKAQGVLSEGLVGIVQEGGSTLGDTAKSLLNWFK